MGDIIFTCPICSTPLQVEEELKGGLAMCYNCESTVMVPMPGVYPGMNLASYIIEELIGTGGMGEVWRAKHSTMGREVAIKILSPAMTTNPNSVAKFMREVETSAKLEHPNIVTAFDAGVENGIYYLVTSFVDGETLKERLERDKTIPEREALIIARKTAEALSYAWNNYKLIHSDINPSNIMLTHNGEVKLMDMGISKTVSDDPELTKTGIIVGTPHYMSPEQARIDPDIDCRADIYSLGATLYHIMTGSFPYEASSAITILARHLTDKLTPPRQKNKRVSKESSALIVSMMAKERDERPQSWEALIADINNVIKGKMPLTKGPTETGKIDIANTEKQILNKRKIKGFAAPKARHSKTAIKTSVHQSRNKTGKTHPHRKKTSTHKKPFKKKASSDKSAKLYIIGAIGLVLIAVGIAVGLIFYKKYKNSREEAAEREQRLRIKLKNAEMAAKAKLKQTAPAPASPKKEKRLAAAPVKKKTPAPKPTPKPKKVQMPEIKEGATPQEIWEIAKKVGNKAIKTRRNFDETIAFFQKAKEKLAGSEFEAKAEKAIQTLFKAQELSMTPEQKLQKRIEDWEKKLAEAPSDSSEADKISALAQEARAGGSGTIITCSPAGAGDIEAVTPEAAVKKIQANSVLKFLPGDYNHTIEVSVPDVEDAVLEGSQNAKMKHIRIYDSGKYLLRNLNCETLEISSYCVIVDSKIGRLQLKDGQCATQNCIIGNASSFGRSQFFAKNCTFNHFNKIATLPALFCDGNSTVKVFDSIFYSEGTEAFAFASSYSGDFLADRCIFYSKNYVAGIKEFDFSDFKLIKPYKTLSEITAEKIKLQNCLQAPPGFEDAENGNYKAENGPGKGKATDGSNIGAKLNDKGNFPIN